MNVLQKGTLINIAATLVVSVMILLSANSVADQDSKIAEPSASLKSHTTQAGENFTNVQVEKVRVVAEASKEVAIPAPPGPFIIEGQKNDNLILSKEKSISMKPVTPTSPVTSLIRKKGQKLYEGSSEPKMAVVPPVFKIKKPVMPEKLQKNDTVGKMQIEAPEFKRSKPSFSYDPPKPSLKPVLKKPVVIKSIQITMPKIHKKILPPSQPKRAIEQPIWMQKDVNTKAVKPKAPAARLTPPVQKAQNMNEPVRPAQQYMYIPMPRYQLQYPQAPGQIYVPKSKMVAPQAVNKGLPNSNLTAPKAPAQSKGVNTK